MFPVSLPLAILILDNFPFCFHFLTESLHFLDYLGWFSVHLNSEQWKWQLKVFQDLSCLFPALIYLALNLRTMERLTLGGNSAVHVVQSPCSSRVRSQPALLVLISASHQDTWNYVPVFLSTTWSHPLLPRISLPCSRISLHLQVLGFGGGKKFWYGRIEGILRKLTNNTQLSMLVYSLKERDDIQNDLDRLEEKAVQMP